MTITLELRPEELAVLSARAQAQGVDIEAVVHDLIAGTAPTPAAQEGKQKAATALMQMGRQEGRTDDPEELAEHDRELEEFKANMNRWRAEEGRPSLF